MAPSTTIPNTIIRPNIAIPVLANSKICIRGNENIREKGRANDTIKEFLNPIPANKTNTTNKIPHKAFDFNCVFCFSISVACRAV